MRSAIRQNLLKRVLITSLFLACSLGSNALAIGKATLDPVATALGTDTLRQRDWEPKRTWVFIVGILKWEDSETFKSFPQANRRDAQLADFFRGAGVPANQLVFFAR